MGKLQVFEVLLEGNCDVYKPGDIIHGQVRIVLSGEKGDIRGIKVVCKGKSYTHWSESRGSGEHRRTIHYSWKIPYFKQEIILRGEGKNNKAASRMKLPMGDHRFPFQFQLPMQSMPPPFEGTVGYVRYYIKTTIDRPWKFDHKVHRFFSIWTVKDLNLMPNILNRPGAVSEKTVCCLCCESGPIRIEAYLDKSGYAPGESILITMNLNNQTGRDIISLKAALIQYAEYKAKHGGSTHKRHSSKRVAELLFQDFNNQDVLNYVDRPMLIPPIPPNNFDNCPNISVVYKVKFEVDVSGTPIDLKLELPIIIGTVPAMPHVIAAQQQGSPYGAQAPPQQAMYPPQGPPQQLATYAPPPGYQAPPQNQPQPTSPYLPPPSYEVAMEGFQQIEGKKGSFGTTTYAPRYPYYHPDAMNQSVGQAAGTSGQGQAPVMMQPQPQQQGASYAPYQQQGASYTPYQQQGASYTPYQQQPVSPDEVHMKTYPAM
ncbi:arrestin domain-containing protein 3-like [Diadema antillarum]|uniref:arrestin domain-containing protein 3-like n=1 Tax=Diadema antillarum TaxID=105358 RepID=UPI003A8A6BC5